MLLLSPILLVLGLIEFITLNQVITVDDFTGLAQSRAVTSVAAHVSQLLSYVSQARHTNMELLELPRLAFQLDVPSPTDLVVYVAPIGAYAWHSSPSIQTYTYRTLAQFQRIRSRVHGALAQSFYVPRPYRHKLHSSQSVSVSLRGQNTSFPILPTCSILYPIFQSPSTDDFAVTATAATAFLGPNMSSLSGLGWCGVDTKSQPAMLFNTLVAVKATPLGPNMSSYSGPGWCGLGTESQPTLSFSTSAALKAIRLGPNMSSLSRPGSCGVATESQPSIPSSILGNVKATLPGAVRSSLSELGWCDLSTALEFNRSDVSTVSHLDRCGLGTQSLYAKLLLEQRLDTIRALPICSLLSSDEEACVNVRVTASSYMLALWVLSSAYVCIKLAAKSLFGLCLFSNYLIRALIGSVSTKHCRFLQTSPGLYFETSIGKQHLRLRRAARQVILELLCLYYFPSRSRSWPILQFCNLQINSLFVKTLRAWARLSIVMCTVYALVAYDMCHKIISPRLHLCYRATVWLIHAGWLIAQILWSLDWILFTRAFGCEHVFGMPVDHKPMVNSTSTSTRSSALPEDLETIASSSKGPKKPSRKRNKRRAQPGAGRRRH